MPQNAPQKRLSLLQGEGMQWFIKESLIYYPFHRCGHGGSNMQTLFSRRTMHTSVSAGRGGDLSRDQTGMNHAIRRPFHVVVDG